MLKLLPESYFDPAEPGVLRILAVKEWRDIGITQSVGWEHYEVHAPEPHILLFRREKDFLEKVRPPNPFSPFHHLLTSFVAVGFSIRPRWRRRHEHSRTAKSNPHTTHTHQSHRFHNLVLPPPSHRVRQRCACFPPARASIRTRCVRTHSPSRLPNSAYWTVSFRSTQSWRHLSRDWACPLFVLATRACAVGVRLSIPVRSATRVGRHRTCLRPAVLRRRLPRLHPQAELPASVARGARMRKRSCRQRRRVGGACRYCP